LIDPIKLDDDICLLAIIGENMKNHPGVAGKLFKTLGQNGINIEAIAQGSSELNITFAIKSKDLIKGLNSIHDSFFLSQY
jgi:aspartokinase/homoserine dehydrogenase 1